MDGITGWIVDGITGWIVNGYGLTEWMIFPVNP